MHIPLQPFNTCQSRPGNYYSIHITKLKPIKQQPCSPAPSPNALCASPPSQNPQLSAQALSSCALNNASPPITPTSTRSLSSNQGPSAADERIESITELYATAQDEFEIAMEETEKGTVYAQEDRDAAREELEKVLEAYRSAVEGEDRELAEEVRRRIGHRVRELEAGVKRMEEIATEHD
jgi:hypothetical protein